MKKILTALCLMLAAVFCLVGCNNTPNTPSTPNNPNNTNNPNNPNNPTVSNDKVLIAYFSLAENMENEVEGNASRRNKTG